MQAFSPLGASASISATASSANAALPGSDGSSVLVYNNGSIYVAVNFGDSSVAATLASTPIPPNTSMVLSLPPGATHFAAIGSGAGPSLVIAQRGAGL